MNYKNTLDYLYTQLPMYQRVGQAAFKKDLTNITKLCDALDNPQQKFPTIHIAGTNGKGSTAHLIASVLQARGLKIGLYTSPHYRDFRERIKINGEYITETGVIDFVEKNRTNFEKIQPSFFEITVALAFDYFEKEKVDFAIIETGLGGRLDSTNIIQPILSVITNISFDHQQFLGDTLPAIAGEKAGIIKAKTPVVIGEKQSETMAVFMKKATEMDAPIYFAADNLKADLLRKRFDGQFFEIREGRKLLFPKIKLNLIGNFQGKNMLTALQAILLFDKIQQTPEKKSLTSIKNGFAKVKSLTNFIGRWEVLGSYPTILCDSAHNEAGLTLAMQEVQAMSFQKLHIVMGVVNDKDIGKVFKIFPKNATYYFAKPNIPRGLDAAILKEKAAEFGVEGTVFQSVNKALAAAKKAADKKDLIYVGGSTFVVAEVI
ncbi:MAG: dihydrofolate synthase/folylpolyglutamate synthase [Paraglaciecola sp.]|jgi:dihydrofolate synthase/folylpolyglutamate synthase